MKKIKRKVKQLFAEIAKLIAPPPELKVSEWADLYRKLSRESSAEPGQWRTDRAPYQRGIMDAINDPDVENVVWQSSSQVGKTEFLLNVIGYHIDYDPAPIMLVQPTLDIAEAYSKDRLAPMLRDTPALLGKVKDVKSKDSGNTLLHKSFPGGHITMSGANSPSSLASRPIRIILLDEIDRYPLSAGTEGDPVSLVTKRATTFWNRKIIKVSTPTNKGASPIEKAYENSSKERWHLPCPSCEEGQPLAWGQIDFDYDKHTKECTRVEHACKHCGSLHSEQEWKSGKGKWIAEQPEIKSTRGFHLNELSSPWKRWAEVVEDFQEAVRDGVEKLKVWTNTSLGESWEEQGEQLDDEKLFNRREEYAADVPDEVILLTAGVDTQDDRLEVEVVGWGVGKESWGIQYHVIHGRPDRPGTWQKLDDFLDRTWKRDDGSGLLVSAGCVDSGGHYTTEVYKYCKKREHRRIYAIKGEAGEGKPIIAGQSRNNREKCLLVRVGVDAGKERIHSNLKTDEPGPGYCHFPSNDDKGYSEAYFKGLTAEKKVMRFHKGKRRFEWHKVGKAPNEPLDLRNYAGAALEILKPNLDSKPALPQASDAPAAAGRKRRRGTSSSV